MVHDSRLVLAAAGLNEGAALVAGTGSVAYGRTADGREAHAGGWGWLLGDDGGGTWMVREAAREVMRRADLGQPLGAMGQALLTACRVPDTRELSRRLHAMHEPMNWAARAPVVFETTKVDAGAQTIVSRAASALCGLATLVCTALAIEGPVVLAGGLLLGQPQLEAAVHDELQIPSMRLQDPPVAGAVRLAEELIRQ